MSELILLGAGASVEAGVPHAYKMTYEMLSRFSSDAMMQHRKLDKVMKFVVGGLLFQQGVKGENPFNGVNIEDLFNAVLMLGDRQNFELSSFISSWHPRINALESGNMSSYTRNELLKSINEPIENFINETAEGIIEYVGSSSRSRYRNRRNINSFSASTHFEREFKDAVRQIVLGSEGTLFKATANEMIKSLVKMVWITENEKVQYLLPLLQYAYQTNSSFVTLNYDNTIELGGQMLGINVDTGFTAWSNTSEFTFGDGIIPLLKLHGSIDWALSNGRTDEVKPLPYQIIQQVDPDSTDQNGFRPAVLFGGKNKLTAKGPFLSLLRSFEMQLEKSEALTVIGYSFRDDHVNEFISNWYNGDPSRRIRIINPNPDSFNDPLTQSLLHGRVQDRVEVIKEKASTGISQITGGS